MFDDVQAGWLAGDDYRAAVERAGVVELPESGDGDPANLPVELLGGRFEDVVEGTSRSGNAVSDAADDGRRTGRR